MAKGPLSPKMQDYKDRPLFFVIFGITGDLARRKLLPAIYHLKKSGLLPDTFKIVGVSRREVDIKSIFKEIKPELRSGDYDETVIKDLINNSEMFKLNPTDQSDYSKLLNKLQQFCSNNVKNPIRLYYLSTPPGAMAPIVKHLGLASHHKNLEGINDSIRLMVEKPFGHDYASAKHLVDSMGEFFKENQIYRIDHYLARETAQNILTFRFNNPLFESVWSKKHIDHITVVAHEKIDVSGRVNFYEGVGALRDLLQSHLLQLLAISTMNQPESLSSNDIHFEKLKLLNSIKPVEPNNAWRGQYKGYRNEANNPNTKTETFARVQLEIDNDTWEKVPIVLETGKALDEKTTRVTICFKPFDNQGAEHNRLTFRIQPDEGITLRLMAKTPGIKASTKPVNMNFDYKQAFVEQNLDPYERVIIDAIRGDQTLFATAEEVLSAWKVFDKVLDAWDNSAKGLEYYPKGSSAPIENIFSH